MLFIDKHKSIMKEDCLHGWVKKDIVRILNWKEELHNINNRRKLINF
jgi:hypothetical protein